MRLLSESSYCRLTRAESELAELRDRHRGVGNPLPSTRNPAHGAIAGDRLEGIHGRGSTGTGGRRPSFEGPREMNLRPLDPKTVSFRWAR